VNIPLLIAVRLLPSLFVIFAMGVKISKVSIMTCPQLISSSEADSPYEEAMKYHSIRYSQDLFVADKVLKHYATHDAVTTYTDSITSTDMRLRYD
jgi:hypothetical protein